MRRDRLPRVSQATPQPRASPARVHGQTVFVCCRNRCAHT
jgi:hypothetical protein